MSTRTSRKASCAALRSANRWSCTPTSTANDVTYHGRVEGLGGGTGSAFAVIPAQNATGNWIRVVQRVPVRISLDPRELAEHPLRVGLSMEARIDVREPPKPTSPRTERSDSQGIEKCLPPLTRLSSR